MDESRIAFAVSELKVIHAQHVLNEAGIGSFVLNKKDSAYAGILGDIQLFVDKADAEKAKAILEEAEVLN